MKNPRIDLGKDGLNVVSPITELKDSEARTADNVVITKEGRLRRRSGYAAINAAGPAHSLWSGNGATLFVQGGALLELKADNTSRTVWSPFFAQRAFYVSQAGYTYVAGDSVLRIEHDGVAVRSGVMDLLGFTPSLASAAGGLEAGTYGVAIAAVNAYGEESGLSDMGTITLAAPGSITFALPDGSAYGVFRWNLYRTPVNGANLYLADHTAGATGVINSQELGHEATGWMRVPLPAGQLVDYQGRLYSGSGYLVYFTDPFSNLCDARAGFIPLPEELTILIDVVDGMYIGTASTIYWVSGNSPKDFTIKPVADNGAVYGSAARVDADLVPGLGNGASSVAVWLTEHGYQFGLPGGRVVTPQSQRVALSGATQAATTPVSLNGVKQLVTAVDSLTIGT